MSRRELAERLTAKDARLDALTEELDAALARAGALEKVAGELSRAKDVIALHIVAAGHPNTVLHDPATFGRALREACDAHHVDIRLELARLEGGQL